MSSEIKLGQLCKGSELCDAVHIATAPVKAHHGLSPGEHIGLVNPDYVEQFPLVGSRGIKKLIGIVDPFLTKKVNQGDKFHLCLYPNTVTSLRHQWTHPDFKSTQIVNTADSYAYIQKEAESMGLSFDELMNAAYRFLRSGDYLCDGGRYEGCYLDEKFWDHFEIVTGQKVPANDRESFFSCSC